MCVVPNRRIYELDIARFFAAINVVLYHYAFSGPEEYGQI